MIPVLTSVLLCVGQASAGPPPSPPPGLDLSPVKVPLDRVAAAVEKALTQIDQATGDALKLLNWAAVAGAVLLTVLVMHTIHLHGLAASKSNLTTEKRS